MTRLVALSIVLSCPACGPSPAPAEPTGVTPTEATQPAPPADTLEDSKPEAEAMPPEPATPGAQDVPSKEQVCGGIAGLRCADAMSCVDDPNDSCDPKSGGADCMGICVAKSCADPKRRYMSRDPSMCARMKFGCDGGQSFFGDECGCGCLSQ